MWLYSRLIEANAKGSLNGFRLATASASVQKTSSRTAISLAMGQSGAICDSIVGPANGRFRR